MSQANTNAEMFSELRSSILGNMYRVDEGKGLGDLYDNGQWLEAGFWNNFLNAYDAGQFSRFFDRYSEPGGENLPDFHGLVGRVIAKGGFDRQIKAWSVRTSYKYEPHPEIEGRYVAIPIPLANDPGKPERKVPILTIIPQP